MKRLKKAFFNLLTLLLVFSLLACGEYHPPVDTPGDTDDLPDDTPTVPPEDDGDEMFTVTLLYNGLPFAPDDDEEIYAQWSDGFTVHKARVGSDGKASVTGLDGDYLVTLSATPDRYTYNPNIYAVTNDARDISIELIRLGTYRGSGKDLYDNVIELSRMNMYRAELKSASDIIYFQFKPDKEGEYTIESWMDVTGGQYNPIVDIYDGTFAYKNFRETVDGGGISSGYTSNFKFSVTLTEEMIGNVYAFGIRVTSKNGQYPAYVDFALMRNGSFEDPDAYDKTMIIPKELGKTIPFSNPTGTFVYAEKMVNGNRQLDGSIWGLNPETGVYQMYNEKTGKYDGPVLYAKISKPCRYLAEAIKDIEDVSGTSYLTVGNGRENYKLFIEGGAKLEAIGYVGWENYVDISGYANYCNSDGTVAVTQELKDFLQKLSIKELYFRDGNGWCETHDVYPTDSTEEDQWLFACGFYLE